MLSLSLPLEFGCCVAVRSVADTVAVAGDREPTPKRSRMCPMVTSAVFWKRE